MFSVPVLAAGDEQETGMISETTIPEEETTEEQYTVEALQEEETTEEQYTADAGSKVKDRNRQQDTR